MPFHIAAELRYSVFQRNTMLLSLHALSTPNQTLRDECFTITEGSSCEFFPLETGDNRYVRLDTGDLTNLLITYAVTAETRPTPGTFHDTSGVRTSISSAAPCPIFSRAATASPTGWGGWR